MKTSADPRHRERIKRMRAMFAASFSAKQGRSIKKLPNIVPLLPQIDAMIAKAAPQWPLDQLNKVDLAILRISIFELLQKETPPKVVMDEAIEIAKEYGAEKSPAFVNGVLATITQQQTPTV